MIRFLAILLPILLLGCADQSKGTALNECRMRYDLQSPTAQADQVPDCMKAKSFQAISECSPEAEQDESGSAGSDIPLQQPTMLSTARCHQVDRFGLSPM